MEQQVEQKQPQKTPQTKQKQQSVVKAKKIQKYALMSPYLNYYEVMPAKPGKDFVSYQLTKVLQALHRTIPPSLQQNVQSDGSKDVQPPPSKRQKVHQQDTYQASSIPVQTIKDLSKNGLLMIGLNQVQKTLIKAQESDPSTVNEYLVFVINDPETAEINKHVIGFCRQFSFHNFLLPKFLKKNCCDLMGTKRLTCFALHVKDEEIRQNLIMRSLKEFDNHPDNREDLNDFKYAEESMFKTCYIKKWQVDLNPKK